MPKVICHKKSTHLDHSYLKYALVYISQRDVLFQCFTLDVIAIFLREAVFLLMDARTKRLSLTLYCCQIFDLHFLTSNSSIEMTLFYPEDILTPKNAVAQF